MSSLVITVRMSRNNGPKPPSRRVLLVGRRWWPARLYMRSAAPMYRRGCGDCGPFNSFVCVKATNAAAFCCLYRLRVHDYHRGTRRPAGFPASFLVDFSLQVSPHTGILPHAEIVIYGPQAGNSRAEGDADLDLGTADRRFFEQLRQLEPFGIGNRGAFNPNGSLYTAPVYESDYLAWRHFLFSSRATHKVTRITDSLRSTLKN